MVSCGQYKMMPMAPTSVMAIPPSSKPKIGFSIDSIVGNSALRGQTHHHHECNNLSPRSESPDRPSSSLSDYNYPLELRNNDLPKDYRISENNSLNRTNRNQQLTPSDFQRNTISESPTNCLKSGMINNCSPIPIQQSLSPNDSIRSAVTRTPSPSSPSVHSQNPSSKGPIVVPGIPASLIRPFPVQPSNMGDMKTLPPYLNPSEVVGSPNSHFLAAQFQMAAAIAHGQSGQGFPPGTGIPQHHPQFNNPNIVRDTYPLYPWLLSRHGRIFPHRFPGNFLLQPFRKPKRVRTAFSPSQLLKLEHAFESNHYVVGAERKTLAQALSLTETQVKVWFQNRRTKHKRMQQEEDAKSGQSSNEHKNCSDNNNGSGSQASYDESEDELIDMDDCPSDQEGDLVP